jgi:hypothetical protein
VADVGLFLDNGRLVREEDFAGHAATVVHPFAHEGAPEGAPEGAEACS